MTGNPPPLPALMLDLVEIPADRVKGIYTIGGVPGRMPPRALFLHPSVVGDLSSQVAGSFAEVLHYATISDMFRSAESSLAAVKSGRGAQPPGFSAHNFGLAIDIDVRRTMKALGLKTKAELDTWMRARGLRCFRRDGKITDLRGESHHYHAVGDEVVFTSDRSTNPAIQRRIETMYGATWDTVDPKVAQAQLARLALYRGDIDGIIGPVSKSAVRVFRRGWGLGDSDRLDQRTFRTLIYVASGRRIIGAA